MHFQSDIKSPRKLFALFLNEEAAHSTVAPAPLLFRKTVPFISYDYNGNLFLVAIQDNYRCLNDVKSWFYAPGFIILLWGFAWSSPFKN